MTLMALSMTQFCLLGQDDPNKMQHDCFGHVMPLQAPHDTDGIINSTTFVSSGWPKWDVTWFYQLSDTCYVIGLLCNNKDVVAYTTLLTATLQVCFPMNILQTYCTTYDNYLYTQLACICVWLILIIIHKPIGHQYFTHTLITTYSKFG